MSNHKGYRTSSNSYGQFYFGGNSFPGFLYKKNLGVGTRRSTQFTPGGTSISNQPTEFWNKYIPGAGVGASSIATRRYKMIRATSRDKVVPSSPTITSITPTNNQIAINFTPPTSNGGAPITYYKYSLDNGSTFTPVGQITSPITVRQLAYSTTYQVIIRAVNLVGDGQISNTASVTITPSVPTITSITTMTDEITINFNPPTIDGGATITNYKYSLNNGSTFTAAGQITSPITVRQLSYNTTYQVIIRAVNSGGDGQISNMVPITTSVPSAPTITSITPRNAEITINFTPPTSNGGSAITNYKYSLNNGSTFTAAGQITSPIIVRQLAYSTTYQVIIRAVNLFGDGTQSNRVSVTTTGTGSLNYSFTYTGVETLTQQLVLNNLPIQTVAGKFEITETPNISIVDSNVNVKIATSLKSQAEFALNIGITFAFNSLTTFYNNSTSNLTFISSNNVPLCTRVDSPVTVGEQFKNLNALNIQSGFVPYFLENTDLYSCFSNCTNFNSNISSWDTTKVTNMSYMFENAQQFNQPINTSGNYWNTLNVTSIEGMFLNASAFNQPIGNWNVEKVIYMNFAFGFTQFKQDISNWRPYSCRNMASMFFDSDMNSPSSATNQNNYNALLNSWGNNPRLPLLKNNVEFDAGLSKYTISTAGTALSNLIAKGWVILDKGGV